jgi:hypothetical protein
MHVVKAKIIRWFILWIINDWINICALSWLLYICIINLDFLYAFNVSKYLISFTNLKLKIRTSWKTISMMIDSNIRFFNKSFISFRFNFIKMKMRIEMRTSLNWFECEFSSWKKTMISAKFWYLNDKRLTRVDLMIVNDWMISKNSADKLFWWSDD